MAPDNSPAKYSTYLERIIKESPQEKPNALENVFSFRIGGTGAIIKDAQICISTQIGGAFGGEMQTQNRNGCAFRLFVLLLHWHLLSDGVRSPPTRSFRNRFMEKRSNDCCSC